MAYVYKHIRLDTNEVFYIGISSRNNKYRANSKWRSNFWKNIIDKTDYKVEIIEEDLTLEEAKEKEKLYIKQYGRRDLGLGSLVNLTDGGDGVQNLSEELKNKISITKKSKNRKCPEHLIEENRKRMLGNSIMKGRKFTEESKQRCTDAKKKLIYNTETGIYYNGILEASESISKNKNYLGKRLIGLIKNNTSFIYV